MKDIFLRIISFPYTPSILYGVGLALFFWVVAHISRNSKDNFCMCIYGSICNFRKYIISFIYGDQIKSEINKNYYKDFEINHNRKLNSRALTKNGLTKDALEKAHEIRTYEIDKYWSRSAYFWVFISVVVVSYGVSYSLKDDPSRGTILFFLSTIGAFGSFGWFLANKGSKMWQENWENHIDMLEDSFYGPLYKTVLMRPKYGIFRRLAEFLIKPEPFSVSKINQIFSAYIMVLWIMISFHNLPGIPISESGEASKSGTSYIGKLFYKEADANKRDLVRFTINKQNKEKQKPDFKEEEILVFVFVTSFFAAYTFLLGRTDMSSRRRVISRKRNTMVNAID